MSVCDAYNVNSLRQTLYTNVGRDLRPRTHVTRDNNNTRVSHIGVNATRGLTHFIIISPTRAYYTHTATDSRRTNIDTAVVVLHFRLLLTRRHHRCRRRLDLVFYRDDGYNIYIYIRVYYVYASVSVVGIYHVVTAPQYRSGIITLWYTRATTNVVVADGSRAIIRRHFETVGGDADFSVCITSIIYKLLKISSDPNRFRNAFIISNLSVFFAARRSYSPMYSPKLLEARYYNTYYRFLLKNELHW
jgi:hypothetical protein